MSEVDKHPIMLRQVFFTKSIVCANPKHTPGEFGSVVGPNNKIDAARMEGNERLYQAKMATLIDDTGDPSQPYQIDMECIGIFEVDRALSEEEAKRVVFITAHSVLYGAIREAVSWITSRQPHGPLTLGLSILGPQVAKSESP